MPDVEGRFSTGIPDLDRLLEGGVPAGATVLFSTDETVGLDDLDLLLFPAFLNSLYQSRGIMAVLPARDSPGRFREPLTRSVSRRRFDSRVRICDYVGEDEGRPYVVALAQDRAPTLDAKPSPRSRKAAIAKVVAGEKAVQGNRGRAFVEYNAFEVFDTLLGSEKALRTFFDGIKRTRQMGNLGIGVLGPGLGCAAGVRRMTDLEIALHRDDFGLIVRGVRPRFPSFVVTADLNRGLPYVAFVPRPGAGAGAAAGAR